MVPVAAFLLDVDGTLIDSNDAHARAWVEAFAEAGIAMDFAKVRASIGMGGDHVLPQLAGTSSDSSAGAKIEKRRGEIFKDKYLETIRPFDGSAELLKTLKAKGFQLTIATSASSSDLKALLKQTGLEDLVDHVVTSADADKSKPNPDIIQAALKKSNLVKESTLMLGDTPFDIEAAKKAGVRTIALTCGGWSEADLKKAGAIAVYENPHILLGDLKTGRAPF